MKHLLQLVWSEKKIVLLSALFGTLSGLTAVALFAQSGFLISKAALMPPFYIILILTAFLKLFGVTKAISKYAERLLSHRVTFDLMSRIRVDTFRALLPQSHILQTYKSGDILSRITNDVETLQHFFLRVVYPPLVALLVFVATILFALIFSPMIAAILLIGLLFTTVFVPTFFIYAKKRTQETEARLELTVQTTEFLFGFQELLLHNALEAKRDALQRASDAFANEQRRALNKQHTVHVWNQLFALAAVFFVLFFGAYSVTTGKLDGVYLAMLILVALTAFEVVIPMANVPQFYEATVDATSRLAELTSKLLTNGTQIAQNGDIALSNISYRYPKALKSNLQNIDLTIRQGEKIAIIGASGSGKSTLLHVLMKELQPKGDVRIAGVSLADIDTSSWHENIAVCLQHNHFFAGTVRDNLQFANEQATDEELSELLQLVHVDKSLDEELLERGANLSGGEKQRLALVRLLLKNSSIWLLDEPFSSIDAVTEEHLLNVLLTRGKDKTIIIVSHHAATLPHVDRVIEMQDGKIVATHNTPSH